MAYLETPGEFEAQINRGILSFRSARLDALVRAIDQFINTQRKSRLFAIRDNLEIWKAQDPKEFANRGAGPEAQLRRELTALLNNWIGEGEINIVDRSAHPRWEPGRWNDNDRIQFSTNCYAYACNDSVNHPIDNKPQPGQIAGMQARRMEDMDHGQVRYAVMADDIFRDRVRCQRLIPLIRLRNDPVPERVVNIPGYYLIALVTAPLVDYHWLRQDADGMWSHKPGWSQATDLDSDGRPIYDPRDAALRVQTEDANGNTVWANYEFTTFYYAPRGGVRTGELGRLKKRGAVIRK